jgi:uncharacterized protein YndB with AHSA1/START domain
VTSTDFNPELDLMIDHIIPITPAQAWEGWTRPEHLTKWFTPAPWTTPEAEIDLQPGGMFRTVMCSPEGEVQDANAGCYLDVVEHRRLVWTSALGPGYAPTDFSGGGFPFTAIIEFEAVDEGTRYTARVMHATAAQKTEHEEMGFADGWTAAMHQLVAHMTSLR